jgi:hypothetical protein
MPITYYTLDLEKEKASFFRGAAGDKKIPVVSVLARRRGIWRMLIFLSFLYFESFRLLLRFLRLSIPSM